jgi:hypothetical protein
MNRHNISGGRLPARVYSTREADWAVHAIGALLEFEDVIVDGVLIQATSLGPQAVWPQLRRRLRAHGIKTPRRVSGEDWP